ncbi:MAG: c-type cytochrome [Sinobacteraceae bacterium]|nr:c-type cytochrome [Nevskiaceae bacterium]
MCPMEKTSYRSVWWVFLVIACQSMVTNAAQTPVVEVKALFANCAACHGADGGGVADGTVPAIGGQPVSVIMRQLQRFRSGERKDLRMQHFADAEHLTDTQQIELVAKHVASLRRSTPVKQGDGSQLDLGARRWSTGCAGCHGAAADAVAARGIPALAGQHAPYIERKLREESNGVPGAPTLSQSHAAVFKRLTPTDRAALADYLSRLPPPKPML